MIHDFKLLLKHLQAKLASSPDHNSEDSDTVVHGPDGSNCRGYVVFSKYEDLDLSSSYFENGVSYPLDILGTILRSVNFTCVRV